ncbi:MAG: hypothetical protein KAS32_21280 [Candidatus Peribacteraceae bacterium]|nr:hypothetical protein [Candidatus Peribacteraceae bacterium]
MCNKLTNEEIYKKALSLYKFTPPHLPFQRDYTYPPFLPYNPDEKTGWISELSEDKSEVIKMVHQYRNAATGKLLTYELAFVLGWLHETWKRVEGYSWFPQVRAQYSDEWVNSGVFTSHYGSSDTGDYALFDTIEKFLKASPWKEEEDWSIMHKGQEVYVLFIRGYDEEKDEITDFLRWWWHSDILEYCRQDGNMMNPDFPYGGSDWENIAKRESEAEPVVKEWPDLDEQVIDRLLERADEQYLESIGYTNNIDLFWKKPVNDVDQERLLEYVKYMCLVGQQPCTNEWWFTLRESERNYQVFWVGVILGGLLDVLEPYTPDNTIPDGLRELYPDTEYLSVMLSLYVEFYKLCEKLPELPDHKKEKICGKVDMILRGLPEFTWDDKFTKKIKVSEVFSPSKANSLSKNLINELSKLT